MAKAMTDGGFTALAAGDPKTLEAMCGVASEIAFDRAVQIALRGHRGDSASVLRFKSRLRKIRRLAGMGERIETLFRSLEREPACRGVLY